MHSSVAQSNVDAIGELVMLALAGSDAGAAVGVSQHGKTLIEQGYGHAQIEHGLRATPKLHFRICSISKQFTCTLALLAAERGELNLDAHPGKYLLELGACNPSMTLRHLCTNQSGLPDYWHLAMLQGARPESRFRLSDAQQLIFSDQVCAPVNQLHEPGAEFSYSNTNFIVLGWILEALLKTTLPRLFKRQLFAPLGMEKTFMSASTADPLPGGPTGYETGADGNDVPALADLYWSGDAGIVTTLSDLMKWANRLDNANSGFTGPPMDLARPVYFSDGALSGYRYGVRVTQYQGQELHNHQGALRGWRSVLLRIPNLSLNVVVFLNTTRDPMRLALAIAQRFYETSDKTNLIAPTLNPRSVSRYRFDSDRGLLAKIQKDDEYIDICCGSRRFRLAAAPLGRSWAGDLDPVSCVETEGTLQLSLHDENICCRFSPLPADDLGDTSPDGNFFNRALDSSLNIRVLGDNYSLSIHGPLGRSENYVLKRHSRELFSYDCERALDQPAPGLSTLRIDFDQTNVAVACQVDNWQVRNVRFERVPAKNGESRAKDI